MLLQERDEFFLKTPFAMMFWLRLDVGNRGGLLQDADREGALSLLPGSDAALKRHSSVASL